MKIAFVLNFEELIQKTKDQELRTSLKLFLIAVFFGVVAMLYHYIKKDALYDFDQVMYAACTFDGFETDAEKVRQLTYDAVMADLGPQKFAQLTDSNNRYRSGVYKSAANLRAQLPFYKLKLIHVNLLRLGYASGYSPFRFSTYINLVCFVLFAVVLLVFLTRKLNFFSGWLAATLIIMMPAVSGTAKLNSPDLLTNLVFTCAVITLLLPRSYRVLSVFLFGLLVFVRPENMLLPVIVSVLGLVLRPPQFSTRFLLTLGAVSLLSYVVLNAIVQPYPWWVLYKHSFMGFIPDPQNPQVGFSLLEYLITLKLIFRTATYSDFCITFFFLCFTIIAAAKNQLSVSYVALCVLLSLVARVLLFPDLSSRYFAGPFVSSLILFLCVIVPRGSKSIEEKNREQLLPDSSY